MKARIFDNGGKTLDRYTIITEESDIFGCSELPFSPLGFAQYYGDWKGGSTKHLGKKIELNDLNSDVQNYIKQVTNKD